MRSLATTTTLAVLAVFAATAVASSGHLDPAFGRGGIVVSNFGNDVRPFDAVLQPDGKIVVVGGVNNFQIATELATVIRYMTDGSLDQSFGKNGVATESLTNFINEAEAVVLQSDGKILILERSAHSNGVDDEFALVRFQSNGHRDLSFGSSGRVVIQIPHPSFFRVSIDTLLLQPDQKILIGGSVVAPRHNPTPPKTVLARYTTKGATDPTFGSNGVTEVVAISAPDAMAVLADGSILAVNISQQTAQFTAKGTLLPRVIGGFVMASTHRGTTAFRSSGTFLVAAGGPGPSGENDLDVNVRLIDPTGVPDPNFRSPLFDFGAGGPFVNEAQAIAIGPTGEIAVAGFSQTPSFGDDFGVARLNSNGSLDATFANGGTLTTHFPHGGQVLVVLIQSDAKIVAIGQSFSGDTAISVDLALARYLTQ